MQRLGGRVVSIDEVNSSAKKGETLEDSVRVMSSYADLKSLIYSNTMFACLCACGLSPLDRKNRTKLIPGRRSLNT